MGRIKFLGSNWKHWNNWTHFCMIFEWILIYSDQILTCKIKHHIRYPDFVLLLSSQMRSQFICFETVPKIVTLADHWVQFNSLNSIWQQLLLLLSVTFKDLGWKFFKSLLWFFFLVGYYQTHFCPCENVTKTSSSKKPEWLIS